MGESLFLWRYTVPRRTLAAALADWLNWFPVDLDLFPAPARICLIQCIVYVWYVCVCVCASVRLCMRVSANTYICVSTNTGLQHCSCTPVAGG